MEKNTHYSTAAIWSPLDHRAVLKWTFFKQKYFSGKFYSVKKINIFFLIHNGAKFLIVKAFSKMELQY